MAYTLLIFSAVFKKFMSSIQLSIVGVLLLYQMQTVGLRRQHRCSYFMQVNATFYILFMGSDVTLKNVNLNKETIKNRSVLFVSFLNIASFSLSLQLIVVVNLDSEQYWQWYLLGMQQQCNCQNLKNMYTHTHTHILVLITFPSL